MPSAPSKTECRAVLRYTAAYGGGKRMDAEPLPAVDKSPDKLDQKLHHPRRSDRLEWKKQTFLTVPLFVVVSIVLVFILVLLSVSLQFQFRNYQTGISRAVNEGGPTVNAILLAYSRSWDFAVVKTCSLFLGFSLVMIGALYVLRIAEAQYQFEIEGPAGVKGNLASSSPGLVILTLGVTLVGLVLFSKSAVGLEESPGKADGTLTPTIEVPPPKPQTSSDLRLSPTKSTPRSSGIDGPPSLSFASGSVALSESELKKVDILCRYLQSHGGDSVTVQAFGDPGESEEFNRALADRRASYIKNLLSRQCSSGPTLKVISYGKEPPVGTSGHGQVTVRSDK
jgi:outer membrane protein OmpA-like peptidoglycan-associated protein